MRYLCDTNIVSEVMRPAGQPGVVAWFTGLDEVCLSVITVEEVHWGLAYKQAGQQLAWFERFLKMRADVLPVTESIARKCGLVRGQLRKRGILRTQADMLIAATALEHDLILATRNTRDFEDCAVPLYNPFN